MNEKRFRALMREAVGDAPATPWLNDAVRARVAQPVPSTSDAPLLAPVAVFVALALIAGVILTPRLLSHFRATTPGVSSPKAVDPSNCKLPVIVGTSVPGHLDTVTAGFVNTATGTFTIDTKASVAGLPDGIGAAGTVRFVDTPLSSYSSATRRWVPVPPDDLSPDGRSYAYLVYLPAAQQPDGRSAYALMRYDIATRRSIRLWRAEFGISVVKWTTRGILVLANTGYRGGPYWMVNPATGATAPVKWTDLDFTQLESTPPFNKGGGFGIQRPGLTAAGETIYVVSTMDRKTTWAFYDTVDGQRVFIFKGSETGTSGFDPWTAFADPGGIWFAAYQAPPTVWHWDESGALGRFVAAIPYDPGSRVHIVGACF